MGGAASSISVMMGYNDTMGSAVDITQQWATGSPAILKK
jgi:hypothetical protein